MPCYCNTIVKINQVKQTTNENINSIIVWAIGTYPIEQEDNEIQMTMFIPINPDDRDPDNQAVFEKNGYYIVSGKIVPEYYRGTKRPKMTVATATSITINKVFGSNNCPLNTSLIGIVQSIPEEVKNTENAIIKTLVNDYTTQDHNFMINIIYPYLSSRFKHFKNSIRPGESLLFVVGLLEVIQNEFYVDAKEISYVDMQTMKKQLTELNSSQIQTSQKSTRSKLLVTHQNIFEGSENHPEPPIPTNTSNAENTKQYQPNSSPNSQRSKHVKIETASTNENDTQTDQEITEEKNEIITENDEHKKNNKSKVHNRSKKNKNKETTRNTRKTRSSKVVNISDDDDE